MPRPPPTSTLFPYTTLFRSNGLPGRRRPPPISTPVLAAGSHSTQHTHCNLRSRPDRLDRKSTRLNSSHLGISYAVFCLKKKRKQHHLQPIAEVRDNAHRYNS